MIIIKDVNFNNSDVLYFQCEDLSLLVVVVRADGGWQSVVVAGGVGRAVLGLGLEIHVVVEVVVVLVVRLERRQDVRH